MSLSNIFLLILRHYFRSIQIKHSFLICMELHQILFKLLDMLCDIVLNAFSKMTISSLRQLWDTFSLRKFRVYLRLYAITPMDMLENEHHWSKITFSFRWRRAWIRAWSSSQFFWVGSSFFLFLFFSSLRSVCLRSCGSSELRIELFQRGQQSTYLVEIYVYHAKDSGSKIDINDCTEIVIRTLESCLYLSTYQIRCLSRRSCWVQFIRKVVGNTTSIR